MEEIDVWRTAALETLLRIAAALSATPNQLLGLEDRQGDVRHTYLARIISAKEVLSLDDLERVAVQVEALAARQTRKRRR